MYNNNKTSFKETKVIRKIFLSEIHILKEIAETLNEGTDLNEVLTKVLKKLLKITSLETGWIFLIDEQGNYKLAASEGLPPALKISDYEPMCTGDCWCVNKFLKDNLHKASNIMECKRLENARLNQWGDTYGLVYHATVPLSAGDEKFGVLNVAVTNKERFEAEELGLLESIAYQIGNALKRIHLTKREQELKVAEERNRLARDLHDSVNQLLYSINVTSKAGINLSKEDSIKQIFADIGRMSQHAQAEMKALIWQLRPDGLKNGLVCALKSYAEILGLQVIVQVKGTGSLPSKIEENLWRIGQEAFNNAIKYSGQKEVLLSLEYKQNHIIMSVEDGGVGFDISSAKGMPSLGLKSIEERITALQGKFSIISKKNSGTSLTVELPY